MLVKFFGKEVNRIMQIQEEQIIQPKFVSKSLESVLNEIETNLHKPKERFKVFFNNELSVQTKNSIDLVLERIKLIKHKFNIQG